MRTLERRTPLIGFAALVFFSALAADFWRNSISWYGYGAVVALIVAGSVAVLVRERAFRLDRVPRALLAFLALAAVSTIWSAYPLFTAAGTVLQLITTLGALSIALVLERDEIIRALSWALRCILALSLAFELVVALVIRAPVFPVWVTAEDRVDPPALLYWSRNLLLEGDKIQGIVGSSSLLAMVALLGLIVFSLQVAAGATSRVTGAMWIALAVAMIGLTRSATIYIGIAAALVVLVMTLARRRATTRRARTLTYAGIGAGLLILAVSALAFRGPLLTAMGKSEELTGRVGIWDAVIGLAQQRPVVGWGWISFWAPWLEPFRDLVERAGVQQLHAHNAWLDVWLQLGIVGVLVFGALVAVTAARSWRLAVSGGTLSLAAPLLLAALLVQSLAESRLLIEGGWVLLVVLATMTKLESRASVGVPAPAVAAVP